MTRTRLSIALLVLFAPAVALAHGGGGNGGGNGNGGVGGGMGNGNAGIGVGSMNGIGHGVGGSANGVGGGSANGNAGMNAPERDVDATPDSGSARGMIAQAREDARERAAARMAVSGDASTNTHPVNHGADVSAEAHLARSQHDGGIGQDVSAVARDKSTLKTHTKTHTKVASTGTSTKTHPVNHGAAVSAEAHLAKTENDGDTVGEDVRAVAQDKSTLKTRTKAHDKTTK